MAGKHWKDCECRKCERGRIEKLQAENERLREALEKIANPDECDPLYMIDISRKALRQAKGGDQ